MLLPGQKTENHAVSCQFLVYIKYNIININCLSKGGVFKDLLENKFFAKKIRGFTPLSII